MTAGKLSTGFEVLPLCHRHLAYATQIRDHKEKEFNLDLSRIAVGGCSAGGHLSAVVAHMCRDASIPLAFQLLSVPVCDMHVFTSTGQLRPDQPYPSYREMKFTQPLPMERMSYFHDAFLGNPRPKELDDDWRVSPMLAKSFKGLAPALVITAEMDPLRDEGEAYARKMNEAGSKAEVVRIKGAPHIVMLLDGILEGGKEYNGVVVRALKKALVE
jgi:acetyl esterase/lipase